MKKIRAAADVEKARKSSEINSIRNKLRQFRTRFNFLKVALFMQCRAELCFFTMKDKMQCAVARLHLLRETCWVNSTAAWLDSTVCVVPVRIIQLFDWGVDVHHIKFLNLIFLRWIYKFVDIVYTYFNNFKFMRHILHTINLIRILKKI